MMQEVEAVAASLGVTMRVSIEKQLAGAEAVAHHKTSMLQDREAGRPMEIEALLGSILELVRHQGIKKPNLDSVYSCVAVINSRITTAPE